MRVSRLAENAINEMVDFLLYGNCLEEDLANDYYRHLTERLCKANSNFTVLQEAKVYDDFIKVIDKAAEQSKNKNKGKIDFKDIYRAIQNAADKFIEGEKVYGETIRKLEFDKEEDISDIKRKNPFKKETKENSVEIKSVSSTNSTARRNEQSKNIKAFTKWFNQKSANEKIQELVKKYENTSLFNTSNDITLQHFFSRRFFTDCISEFLNYFAKNKNTSYHFVAPINRDVHIR